MKLLQYVSIVAIAYEDTIIEYGVPNKTVADNTKALISNEFKDISHKYSISTDHTVHTVSTECLLKEKAEILSLLFANACTTHHMYQ